MIERQRQRHRQTRESEFKDREKKAQKKMGEVIDRRMEGQNEQLSDGHKMKVRQMDRQMDRQKNIDKETNDVERLSKLLLHVVLVENYQD